MTVPTVERGLRLVVFCSMEMAGDRPVDQVDVGLLHHLQELARIGRQALDIAALALGVDRVEGERGLARAGQPGDDHQLVARDVDVDVLEIVLARAAHRDMCLCQKLTRPTLRRRVTTHLYLRAIMAKLKPGVGVTPSYSCFASSAIASRKDAGVNDANPLKRIEDKQILVAGDDAISLAQQCDFEQLVIIWIVASFERA